MTQIERISADQVEAKSAMICQIRIIRVLLTPCQPPFQRSLLENNVSLVIDDEERAVVTKELVSILRAQHARA